MAIDPDPWPEDVKRKWTFTMTWIGLDGNQIVKEIDVAEKERLNENFMRALVESCNKMQGGWAVNEAIAKRHFEFAEMPPLGAKLIAYLRHD